MVKDIHDFADIEGAGGTYNTEYFVLSFKELVGPACTLFESIFYSKQSGILSAASGCQRYGES